MKHREVESVMTPVERVVSVHVDTSYKEIAALLAEHRISAVPVVNESFRVLGVVSEADLLAKEGSKEEGDGKGHGATRAEQAKSAGTTAGELMTVPAVTIGPDDDVVRAARLMADRRVKRLPVVDPQGRLLGIVSRRDVISVFLRSDEDIRDDLAQGLVLGTLWLDPSDLGIQVDDGVVLLTGEVPTRGMAELIGTLAGRGDGVVGVVNDLTYAVDDTLRQGLPGQLHGVFERRRRQT